MFSTVARRASITANTTGVSRFSQTSTQSFNPSLPNHLLPFANEQGFLSFMSMYLALCSLGKSRFEAGLISFAVSIQMTLKNGVGPFHVNDGYKLLHPPYHTDIFSQNEENSQASWEALNEIAKDVNGTSYIFQKDLDNFIQSLAGSKKSSCPLSMLWKPVEVIRQFPSKNEWSGFYKMFGENIWNDASNKNEPAIKKDALAQFFIDSRVSFDEVKQRQSISLGGSIE